MLRKITKLKENFDFKFPLCLKFKIKIEIADEIQVFGTCDCRKYSYYKVSDGINLSTFIFGSPLSRAGIPAESGMSQFIRCLNN